MKSTLFTCCAAILLGAVVPLMEASGAPVELQNGSIRVKIDSQRPGGIVSLVDVASGVDFVAPQTAPRLFTLALSKKAEVGGERFYLSSRDARSFSVRVERGVATLSYDGLGEWPVRVTCTASTSAEDSLVRWRLSATIPDALVLEEVQFPFVVLRAPLGESVTDDAAVFGHTKGGVIREPAAMKVGSRVYGRQPGSLAAQFACYYDGRAGFYTAAYDGTGYPKDFEMRRTAEGLEMDWNPHCFAVNSYAMDFDVVMTTFASADPATPTDWRDAADIYKAWALRQPWCATPYARREDVPSWMKDGPAMVRFNRDWLADPSRIEKWVEDYWKKHFPEAPLITAYWGWEKVGNWVTPDYFPVFPSDAEFTGLVKRLRPLGCRAFPWPSGYHWTLTYRKQDDGSFSWDDRKRFDEVARPHAVHQRDGKLYIRTPRWLAGGDTACLCPGDPWTIDWWNSDVCAPLAGRGCEMIQVDQVVGGSFPFCYCREHSHPAGPGRWMTEVFAQQLRTMRATMRAIQPDAVVCFEEPNERFNHLVGIQDYRDCEAPRQWASVFNYLYHEFLPTFQSNPRADDAVMMAHCLVDGQIPHMVPSMRLGCSLPVNGGFEEHDPASGWPTGWEHVRGYKGQVWNGKAIPDNREMHNGTACLQLENTRDSDVVQVSQNVAVSESGFSTGNKYRLSAWMKTGRMVRSNGIGIGFLAPGVKPLGNGARLLFPAAGKGWSRVAVEFTVPDGAAMMRIMIHIEGEGQAWVDDMTLEEVLPDGTAVPTMSPDFPPNHPLMRRWVELYHGEGRPWLQFGRMLHPPKLTCATITYRDRPTPAVLHNAFRAPDGRKAVVLANATREPQRVSLFWEGREYHLDLEANDVLLRHQELDKPRE